MPETRDAVYGVAMGSNLFARGRRLYLIEEVVVREPATDEPVWVAPGMSWYNRLVELNPKSGHYRATYLFPFADEWDPAWSQKAFGARLATSDGYLYRGAIYRVNAEGEIIAIDLKARNVRVVGPVSKTLRTARKPVVVASGNADKLTFLIGGKTAVLETYDLDTGRRIVSMKVNGLENLFEHGVDSAGMAILQGLAAGDVD